MLRAPADQSRLAPANDHSSLTASCIWGSCTGSGSRVKRFALLLHVLQVEDPALKLDVADVLFFGPAQSLSDSTVLNPSTRCCARATARTLEISKDLMQQQNKIALQKAKTKLTQFPDHGFCCCGVSILGKTVHQHDMQVKGRVHFVR